MDRDDFDDLMQEHRANCEKIHALQFSIRQLSDMEDQLLQANFELLERLSSSVSASNARRNNRDRDRRRDRGRESSSREIRSRWNRMYHMAQQRQEPEQQQREEREERRSGTDLLSAYFTQLAQTTTNVAPIAAVSSASLQASAIRATPPGGETPPPTADANASNLMFEYDIPLSQINNFMQMIQNFGEPVEVPLTSAEIEAATRTATYSSIVAPQNTTCPIQLDPFQDEDVVMMIRGCGHLFQRDALMNWFQRNHRCPMCRMDIRERT